MPGIKRTLLFRIILFSIATFLSILSGFILVRKLDFTEYAAYQSLNKRATALVSSLYLLYNIWIYRDALRLRKGTFRIVIFLGYLLGSTIGLVGFFVVYSVAGSIVDGILAFSSIFFFSLWLNTGVMLDALRPIRVGLARVITRFSYALFVIISVYYAGLGLTGALASLTLGYMLGTVLNIKWTLGKTNDYFFKGSISSVLGLLKSWTPRMKASFYMFLRPLFLSLDVFILIPFVDEKIIASFFAYRVISGIMYETFNSSLTVLHREGLKGSNLDQLLTALRTAMILPIIILIYSSVYHREVAYLLGSKYLWASLTIILLNFATLVNLLFSGLYNASLGLIREQNIEKESIILEGITKITVFPVIPYILTIIATGLLYSVSFLSNFDVLVLWSIALLLSRLLDHVTMPFIIKYTKINLKDKIIKKLYIPTIFYMLIALIASLVSPPASQSSTKFIPQAINLLQHGLVAFTVYIIIIVSIDESMRTLFKTLLSKSLDYLKI